MQGAKAKTPKKFHSATAEPLERFYYLTAFDGGTAARTWPHKDPERAKINRSLYHSEIQRILAFHLLWRPFVLLRHTDLFDNLALATFLQTDAARHLSASGLIRVSAPEDISVRETFERWALGERKPGQSQHWHHLTSEQQLIYDTAFSKQQIKSIEDVGKFIELKRHSLDLSSLLNSYDGLFRSGALLVAPRGNLSQNWYAKQVCKRWSEYLEVRKQRGLGSAKILDEFEEHVATATREQWRRRRYYTKLEELEKGARKGQRELLEEIKTLVVNEAFFDEFEHFELTVKGAEARISAVRDVPLTGNREEPPDSLEALALSASVPYANEIEEITGDSRPVISEPIGALDELTIEQIAGFHSGTNEDSRAFQKSIRKLAQLGCDASETEVKAVAAEHIEILRACARRAFRGRPFVEDTVAEVFLGCTQGFAAGTTAIATSIMAALTAPILSNAIVTASLGLLFTVVLGKKATTNQWKRLEAILVPEILAHTGESDLKHRCQ